MPNTFADSRSSDEFTVFITDNHCDTFTDPTTDI
jgi:hypothetical protein